MSELNSKESDEDDNVYGPVLPKNFLKSNNDEQNQSNNINDEKNNDDDEVYGPILPSSFVTKPIIGPSLPKNFQSIKQIDNNNDDDDDDYDDNHNDNLIIGPLPPGEIDPNHMHNQNRSIQNETNLSKREKWMLEPGKSLGKAFQILNKSITKFSQKSSSKQEKNLTEDEKMEIQIKEKNDKKMAQLLEEYQKTNKRERSLMEIHRENLRKNKKSKSTTNQQQQTNEQRREFDREKDLCITNVDTKRKNKLINEASSSFVTKFSSGKFEKFL